MKKKKKRKQAEREQEFQDQAQEAVRGYFEGMRLGLEVGSKLARLFAPIFPLKK